MKVRNIKITIKSDVEFFKEVKNVWKKLEQGEKVKKHEGISFESLETMRKVLTEERLRILKIIKKYHPGSIYELAKILKRDTKNVSDDVHYLAELALIEIEKGKSNGREKTTPVVNYDKILLEIPV
ncbi:MAG: ArsR family transcriptional regulator [Candidatus Omnitrophica bacterium CG23_combo_of_CG06-09_8_20_14_all_41_10]|jgi:predicted transcriptional regulator|uniref:ArsR family transcriptional regulator n=1 Tax=Candidatus Sherwoodlollariibacterium unditelluris TaxID=1974757 RepID=A0A2G9YJM2_9BACT|nr:MAG: ArsR family transcriptional regulator [Candidatus Omnitrophica bacterium CG23_combo_of_CG06-09_8_20_14_all_41_10]